LSTDARRERVSARPGKLADEPRPLATYMTAVGLAAIAASIVALAQVDLSPRGWGTAGWLALIAIGFDEVSRRTVRLKIRISPALRTDMTSVWAIAAAVALTPGRGVLLLAFVLGYDWFRHHRPAGEPLHRKLFVGATILLGVLLSGIVVRSVYGSMAHSPWMLTGLVAVVAGIFTYTAVNRGLVTVVLLATGVRGRGLLGSGDDNLVELATLCLGGLVALAAAYQPWLAVLAIAPMFTLQRGALLHEMETAATTDAKTGLLNAIAWEHLAERELARARRDRYPLGVLIVDIDRFKKVNDEFGHLVGDHVLRRVGKAIAAEVREYDGVGRFGGEEFVVLLPEVDAIESMVVAERIRVRIERLRVSELVEEVAPADDDRISVSIGVTSSTFGGDDVADLLRAADLALYRAKAEGRNRVVLAGTRGLGDSSAVPSF
jgi:diguanylate cyclase (GGDEF)-like protein